MKQSISLVLSSGGARGVAHIGVIEELERQGFEIKSIAGASIGAVVGGIYASGNLNVFRDWICTLDKVAVFNLMDFTLSTNGLLKGNKVIWKLKKMIPDINIEDLSIPFTAVATDVKGRKEVVFEKGDLFEAIRASISMPTFLTPVKRDEMLLIDGGILNPLPINKVKRSNNDLLIAVDVNGPVLKEDLSINDNLINQEDKELSYFSFIQNKLYAFLPKIKGYQFNYYTLLTRSIGLMVQQISSMTLAHYPPDIFIQIPINSYGAFHFYKSDKIIKSGEIATRMALSEFQHSNKNHLPGGDDI